MSIVHLRRSDKTVDSIVRAAFPKYNGQRVEASIRDKVQFHGTQWDEGSRNVYRLVRLADLSCVAVESAPYFDRSAFHEASHTIPAGFVVVTLATFLGKDHIVIVGPAANITPMLPESPALTEDEKTVLIATRSLKSSYAGVSNYRFSEARRARGITADRWESAKSALIAKRFLNRAGAITVEGRNAIGYESL